MSLLEPLRFHFHASGYALSGHFHRPVDVPIPAQASLALPIEGGHAHSGVDQFEIPRIASFRSALTHLSGSWENENKATTSVTVVVQGLSILDFLTVDKMVTRLTSEYEFDAEESQNGKAKKSKKANGKKNSESHIIAVGSHFEGLKLGGYEVKVTLRHDLLLDCKSFEDLHNKVKNEPHVTLGDEVLLCSLVEKIETDLADLPGVKIEGHTIKIPHFGKIAFAEVFAGRGVRTLTMLRFHLGSPDGGGGTGGGGSTNGTPPKGN